MSEGYPAERFQVAAAAPKQAAALIRFGHHPDLDPQVHELVALRASQLNGCAFCIDMHWLDAKAGGEDDARLYGLDAWRESPLYDERERAALALATRALPGNYTPADREAAGGATDDDDSAVGAAVGGAR